MGKEHFDYSKVSSTEDRYYGFHFNNGRLHIDTKRLKDLGYKDYFPELFATSRNTHYFIPKYKSKNEYAVNYLVSCIETLKKYWHAEYIPLMKQIISPEDVYQKSRLEGLMTTGCKDDYDGVEFEARMDSFYRIKKYNELIKSIRIQYLIRSFTEYLRSIYLMLVSKDFPKQKDFQLDDLIKYANKRFPLVSGKSQIELLPHYLYMNLANKLCNFLKHHSESSYSKLANNRSPDPKEKAFYASFVYCDEKHKFETGMYAGDWVKIDEKFIPELLDGFLEFSKELCRLLYNEDYDEAIWNSDDQLLKRLKDEVIVF